MLSCISVALVVCVYGKGGGGGCSSSDSTGAKNLSSRFCSSFNPGFSQMSLSLTVYRSCSQRHIPNRSYCFECTDSVHTKQLLSWLHQVSILQAGHLVALLCGVGGTPGARPGGGGGGTLQQASCAARDHNARCKQSKARHGMMMPASATEPSWVTTNAIAQMGIGMAPRWIRQTPKAAFNVELSPSSLRPSQDHPFCLHDFKLPRNAPQV